MCNGGGMGNLIKKGGKTKSSGCQKKRGGRGLKRQQRGCYEKDANGRKYT